MKISNILYILSALLFFCAILLVRFQFGSYSFYHIGVVSIIGMILVFPEKVGIRQFIRIDAIVLSLLFFLTVVICSYLNNLDSVDSVSKIYSANSGETPSLLYFKIALNGVIFVINAIIAYLLGRSLSNSKRRFFKIYSFVITLCLINAIVNIITWFIVTGGVIGRYNFEPPITFSPGISIQYSSIGFLLALPLLNDDHITKIGKRLTLACLAIFLFSILIILTRQSQISFIIMCVWYSLKTQKISIKRAIWVVPAVLFVVTLGICLLFLSGALDSYGLIDSTDSVDVAIRVLMLNSAYELFLSHPLFGIGYGMFVGHNTIPIVISGVPTYLASPHNGLASILCELGLFGVVSLVTITTLVIMKLKRALRQISDPLIYKYCAAIFVVQIVFMLSVVTSNSNLFGPPSEIPYLYISFISWFMIGSVMGIKRIHI